MSNILFALEKGMKDAYNAVNSAPEVRQVVEKIEGVVMNYTEVEKLVREATNQDPWGPTGPLMKEISEASHHYDTFPEVMGMLWKRLLTDPERCWRRVYKSLRLLNYLVRNGSEKVVSNVRQHTGDLQKYEHYKFIDISGKDQGLNVRLNVKELLELMDDEDRLRMERNQSLKARAKYSGISSMDYGAAGSMKSSKSEHGGTSGGSSLGAFDDFDPGHGQKSYSNYDLAEYNNSKKSSDDDAFRDAHDFDESFDEDERESSSSKSHVYRDFGARTSKTNNGSRKSKIKRKASGHQPNEGPRGDADDGSAVQDEIPNLLDMTDPQPPPDPFIPTSNVTAGGNSCHQQQMGVLDNEWCNFGQLNNVALGGASGAAVNNTNFNNPSSSNLTLLSNPISLPNPTNTTLPNLLATGLLQKLTATIVQRFKSISLSSSSNSQQWADFTGFIGGGNSSLAVAPKNSSMAPAAGESNIVDQQYVRFEASFAKTSQSAASGLSGGSSLMMSEFSDFQAPPAQSINEGKSLEIGRNNVDDLLSIGEDENAPSCSVNDAAHQAVEGCKVVMPDLIPQHLAEAETMTLSSAASSSAAAKSISKAVIPPKWNAEMSKLNIDLDNLGLSATTTSPGSSGPVSNKQSFGTGNKPSMRQLQEQKNQGMANLEFNSFKSS